MTLVPLKLSALLGWAGAGSPPAGAEALGAGMPLNSGSQSPGALQGALWTLGGDGSSHIQHCSFPDLRLSHCAAQLPAA